MSGYQGEIDRLVTVAFSILIILMFMRYPLLDSFFNAYSWSELWYIGIQGLLTGFVFDDGKPLNLSRDTLHSVSVLMTVIIASFTTFIVVIWLLNISSFTTVLVPAMVITFLTSWFIGIFLRRRHRRWSRQVQTEQ